MKNNTILTVLSAVSFCFMAVSPSSIQAADVTLTIGNGSGFPGSPDNQIEVSMNNSSDSARSLQMDITDVGDYLICTGCTPDLVRAPQFACFVQEQVGGECRVLLFSFNQPTENIEEGVGAILTIDYAVNGSAPAEECIGLTLEEVKISDTDKQPLDVTSVPGEFCFSVCVASGECDDENECTNDTCEAGQCVYECNAIGGDDPCCVDLVCGSYPICIDPFDADRDGIPDSEDNCPDTPNVIQTNSDSDSLGDACDNCPTVNNEDQDDSDANGIGDACDYRFLCGDVWPRESAPGVMDCGDGAIDLFNNLEMVDIILGLVTPSDCQLVRGDQPNGMPPYCGNPANCGSDGVVDIFDALVVIDKILGRANCINYCLCGIDSDADGIPDSEDNCPEVYNPEQGDDDLDGMGDACDNCPSTPNGSDLGTCVKIIGGLFIGTGVTCTSSGECEIDEFCDTDQFDFNDNSIGDACECHADMDGDGNVYPSDLMSLIDEYGRTDCCTNPPCLADINDDCNVFPSDLMILIEEYGNTGCPIVP